MNDSRSDGSQNGIRIVKLHQQCSIVSHPVYVNGLHRLDQQVRLSNLIYYVCYENRNNNNKLVLS